MPSLLVEKLQIEASIPEHADEIHLIRRRSHHSPFLKSFGIMTHRGGWIYESIIQLLFCQ